SPGVFTETIHLFLARDLSPVPTELEAGEVLVAHWLPLEEALDRVTGGAIRDGKTQLGILRAAMQLGLLRRSVS
ncbi:MAG: hypothetical protein NZM12_09675, partial [Steroidobacteraceae bacterium]|nr:hypothetical protein [Steroidobacteraceae bacterium]MDW8259467.1 hypothetical protein [Gammaproteobacteria bacterium]